MNRFKQSDESEEEEEKEEEVMGEGMGESQMKELIPEWGWRRDKASWFRRQGEVAYGKERSVIFIEDDVDGRVRVTTDEMRVLRGRWTEIKL